MTKRRFMPTFTRGTMSSKHVFLTTLVLIIVVFVIGIMVGRTTSLSGFNEVSQFLQQNELDTESYLIEQELMKQFEEDNCGLSSSRLDDLSHELWLTGKTLDTPDAQESLGEKNYHFLKRKYHLMQIRAYLLLNKLRSVCDTSPHVILFYFSREENASKEQGKILDQVVAEYNVTVFAIEYNYSKEIVFLEDYYGITTTPFLVINYEDYFKGLTSYEKIQESIGA